MPNFEPLEQSLSNLSPGSIFDANPLRPSLLKAQLKQRLEALQAGSVVSPASSNRSPAIDEVESNVIPVAPTGAVLGPPITGTNASETLIGTADDEEISGLGGNDRLEGRAGDDTLSGGAGNDTVFGGAGDDLVVVSNFNGIDFFDGGFGTDTLRFAPDDNRNLFINVAGRSVGDGRVGGQTFTAFDIFVGGGGNDRILGNGFSNTLRGGAGNDTIEGANGNDTLSGGAGDDSIFGGTGNDLVVVSDFNGIDFFDGGFGIDTLRFAPGDNRDLFINVAARSVGDGRAGGQTFTAFDIFVGGGGNDRILGNEFSNTLRGGAGNDTIEGANGNDTLTGGAGRDHFVFASINDQFDTITDFVIADDVIEIDAVGFGGGLQAGTLGNNQFVQGTAAQDSNDRFIYNANNGQLLFDADGSGNGAAVQVARLTNTPALNANNIVIEGNAPPVSSFDIEINFTDSSLSASQQAIFSDAAARWSEIITEDIPDIFVNGFGLVDDVVIDASAIEIDGAGGPQGNVLGQAGPRLLRNGSFLPARGIMEFDSFDLDSLEADGRLEDVILHEMGHVLGIGTIWDRLNLLTGAGGANPRFIGAQATAEYNSIFGTNDNSVPVENTGGPGTRDGHWRETIFGNELLTGRLNGGVNPISRVTVGSLADIGYTVNFGAADPYTPPNNLVSLLDPNAGGIQEQEIGEVFLPEVQVLTV